MCFFGKQRPSSVNDIAHFDSLRWEDQQKVTETLGNNSYLVFYEIMKFYISNVERNDLMKVDNKIF